MNDLNNKKGKHLTKEDRGEIQILLDGKMNFKAIAKYLNNDQTTISKEVKKRLIVYQTSTITKDEHGNPIDKRCPLLLRAPFVFENLIPFNFFETVYSIHFLEIIFLFFHRNSKKKSSETALWC